MNMDALGFYVEIRFDNIKIFKSVYLNRNKKGWADIDWNNFNFFNEK